MIIPIAPKYKFVCDRCGKEKFPKDDGYMDAENACEIAVAISFSIGNQLPMPKRIQVCRECRDDFENFLENFQDSANKEVLE
jgi:hypothetical protein